MSLHLEFEPHSWYKGFAIRNNRQGHDQYGLERPLNPESGHKYTAYTANGNTYYIDEVHADTLKALKLGINDYHKQNARRDYENRRRLGEYDNDKANDL